MDAGDAWCWQHAVTACAWANRLREVLDALLDAKDAELVRPLAHHLAEYDRSNEKVFSALRDIAAMRRLAPPERGQRAAELYEVLNDEMVPSFQSEKVEAAVEEGGAKLRDGLLHAAFPAFLSTRGLETMRRLVADEAAAPGSVPAALRVAPPSGDGWLPLLRAGLEELPQAVALVDMTRPGLPLAYVNAAWERLTGYSRHEVLGRNARFLQGESTEEAAVAQIVQSVRECRSCEVCVSNYRKDGGRFRNALSLHPVRDSSGEYRYVIGLASDADGDAQQARLALVRKLLPRTVDAAFEPRVDRPWGPPKGDDISFRGAHMSSPPARGRARQGTSSALAAARRRRPSRARSTASRSPPSSTASSPSRTPPPRSAACSRTRRRARSCSAASARRPPYNSRRTPRS